MDALLAALPRPATLPGRHRWQARDRHTIRLDRLPPPDRRRVERIYAALLDLYAVTGQHAGDPNASFAAIQALDEAQIAAIFDDAQRLGEATPASNSEALKALHDVRGGSLAGLLTHIDLIHEGIAGLIDAERVQLLVRDHLKIVRNAVCDVDPARAAADEAARHHGMELLQEKWAGATYHVADRVITVELETTFRGAVSEQCMEFSSLDRVLYNLVNNAGRFSASGRVVLRAEAVDDALDTHLRFAVINPVGAAHVAQLADRFGGDLSRVFLGGFTTGGHGLGLRICADLVRHAYALLSVEKALAEHLLGAFVQDGHYVAWFHWPARRAA
jgi:signal transduction histidine kinase